MVEVLKRERERGVEGKHYEELRRAMRRRLSGRSKAGLGRKLLPEQGRARPKGSKGSLHKHGDDKRPGKFEAKKEEAEELDWRVTEESRRREAGRWPEAD